MVFHLFGFPSSSKFSEASPEVENWGIYFVREPKVSQVSQTSRVEAVEAHPERDLLFL